MNKTEERIYVCHTFYNVYITMLKEFALPQEKRGQTDIALSNISTDFTGLKERLEKERIFKHVYVLDEKKDSFFPELARYKASYNNILRHLYNRIVFTKKFPRLMEPYISIDFKKYREVNVYCDSDPIGYYLNYRHIYYHGLEDGLDTLKYQDSAFYDNQGHFGLKAFLAKWNIIFIQNGFSKYCLDMEVNDLSCLRRTRPNYIEVPRKPLEEGLDREQKKKLLRVFMEDGDRFFAQLREKGAEGCVLFLTQPHPKEKEIRKQVCLDIIRDYCGGAHVVIKPHPRDLVDYEALCPDCTVIKGKFPVEVLNFVEGVHFKTVISIITTALDTLDFADEKINLGESFWDRYEDPAKHNWRQV